VLTPAGTRLRLVITGIEHDQTFEAADYQELSTKLTKALTHANKFIDRLSRENKAMKDVLSKVSALIVQLSRCENRLSPEANEVLQQIAALIANR
jgi:hypothetical protein